MNFSRATPLQASQGDEATWLARLVGATTPAEVAKVVAAFAQDLAGCSDAIVAWAGSGLPRAYSSSGPGPDHERIGRARALLASNVRGLMRQGQELVVRLLPQERAFLMLEIRRSRS